MGKRRIVVTSALPYANGDIHLGHLVEYLQTDFWVRYQKLRGNECTYVCADDTHGTPIMIRAKKDGITPEELIAESYKRHTADFSEFQIKFDNFYSTNSPENLEFCKQIYAKLKENKALDFKSIPQLYCPTDKMFLPDRFVRGTCPKCGAEDQYGDSCEKCGATYNPTDLKDVHCSVCGERKLETRESEHIFFNLEQFKEYLRAWLKDHTAEDVANKLYEWFDEGTTLMPWDISRDAPYFGFEIPDHPGKYFYVWLDAPVGYMASLKNWCTKNNEDFDAWWNNPDAELYHFIGKDIVRFHCLFWPAMLHAADFKGPSQVFVHGFLTVNGKKMSKSRGTFISARTYLDCLDPAFLRYYYACKLNNTTDDVDLNLEDFVQRVNSDLVGKITNLASRGVQMLNKRLDDGMGVMDEEGLKLRDEFLSRAETIAAHYEARRFSQVPVEVCRLADLANEYFDAKQPWATIKTDPEATRVTLTNILNLFRIMAIYLSPILPVYAEKAAALFGEQSYTWEDINKKLENQKVAKYEYLASRVPPEKVEEMVEKSKAQAEAAAAAAEPAAAPAVPLKPEIEFPEFDKVDMRVALVESAGFVEGSTKLLQFTLDLGPLGKRNIFSGIRAYYPDPQVLVGKKLIVVANLKARKMRFGVSEGMILSAGSEEKGFSVLTVMDDAQPGDLVS